MKRIIQLSLALLVAAVSLAAQGGLKITCKNESEGMAPSKSTTTTYFSERYSLVKDEAAKTDILFDFKDLINYTVDHKNKVISKMSWDDTMALAEMAMKAGGGQEIVGRMLDPLSVERAGTEDVAGRQCEKWAASVGNMSIKVSVDPSLSLPVPKDAYKKMSQGALASVMSNPLFADSIGKMAEAVANIDGFQLKNETVLPMGPITIRHYTEVIEVEKAQFPASMFELPKGYEVVDTGKKMLEMFNGMK